MPKKLGQTGCPLGVRNAPRHIARSAVKLTLIARSGALLNAGRKTVKSLTLMLGVGMTAIKLASSISGISMPTLSALRQSGANGARQTAISYMKHPASQAGSGARSIRQMASSQPILIAKRKGIGTAFILSATERRSIAVAASGIKSAWKTMRSTAIELGDLLRLTLSGILNANKRAYAIGKHG
jgi:hypothetical protein